MNTLITLESIIVSGSSRRPARNPDYQAENSTLVWLVGEMARAPSEIFQRLVEGVLKLTQAQSAGISLLSENEEEFVWPAVIGDWAAYVWGGTPRNFSPCGTVLDQNCSLLMSRPQRYFPYLADVVPNLEELLLVPFHINDKAMGTIWAIVHDGTHQFDSEDERLLADLSRFVSAAYRTLSDIGSLKFAR